MHTIIKGESKCIHYILTILVNFLVDVTKTTKGKRVNLGSQFKDIVHRGEESREAGE